MSIGEIGGIIFLGALAIALLLWVALALPGDTTRR